MRKDHEQLKANILGFSIIGLIIVWETFVFLLAFPPISNNKLEEPEEINITEDPNWIPGYNIAYDGETRNRTIFNEMIILGSNIDGWTFPFDDFSRNSSLRENLSVVNVVDILFNGTMRITDTLGQPLSPYYRDYFNVWTYLQLYPMDAIPQSCGAVHVTDFGWVDLDKSIYPISNTSFAMNYTRGSGCGGICSIKNHLEDLFIQFYCPNMLQMCLKIRVSSDWYAGSTPSRFMCYIEIDTIVRYNFTE